MFGDYREGSLHPDNKHLKNKRVMIQNSVGICQKIRGQGFKDKRARGLK